MTVAGGLPVVANVTPALAQQQQICGNNGTGYCLNAWNNGVSGNPVLMYYGGNPNENFSVQRIKRCDGLSEVTSPVDGIGTTYCPFSDHTIDNVMAGAPIVQLKYGSTNLCVAVNTANGHGVMGDCNSTSTGTGGATGTVLIEDSPLLYNLYYTNLHNPAGTNSPTLYVLLSGGNPQQPLIMNSVNNATSWGGL